MPKQHNPLSLAVFLFAVTLLAATARAAETVCIKIDVANTAGKIRTLHGTNLAPTLSRQAKFDITPALKGLDIPLTRLHDASWENNGMHLVDIPMVFPLFHLDHQNPNNYYFIQTDDYIANCLASGSKILYRLGVTIEHSKKKYFTAPPADYDKWTEICINIIQHYNEGWANGFHHNIEYWEIWNEANNGTNPEANINHTMWSGSWADYIRLYVTASKKIKQRFPNVKVGGPAFAGWPEKLAEEFLTECKRQNAPLDFFSWHTYTGSPNAIIAEPRIVRDFVDKRGFNKTELHMNEWHYVTPKWASAADAEEANGIDGAAFLCAVLSGWQDGPLDMGNYYTGTTGILGLFDYVGKPNKCYFGMKAFNTLTKYENRISLQIPEKEKDIWVLAGRKENGQIAILVSCFKNPSREIKLQLENYNVLPGKCKVCILDKSNNLQPINAPKISGSEITLSKRTGSAVFLVELAQ